MGEAALKLVDKPRFRLKEARVQRIESRNTIWDVVVEAGTPFEAVLEPEFWSHVVSARNMIAGDEIRLRPDEGHYVARLFVRDVGNLGNWAKVALLEKVDFDGPQDQAGDQKIDGFEVQYKGPIDKHVVVNTKTGNVILSKISTKLEATALMEDHVRQMNR